MLNSRSDVILPHKKFTWADFSFFLGGGINTDIHPRRYAPGDETVQSLRVTSRHADNDKFITLHCSSLVFTSQFTFSTTLC